MTAPLAIVKVNGIAIAKIRDIRLTENFQRGKVKGLGQIHKDEAPVLDWDGTLSASMFCVDMKNTPIPGLINRSMQTIEEWTDTVLLQEDGVDITIFKKVKAPNLPDNQYPGGIITSGLEVFATIKAAFMNRDGFNISEGQVTMRDMEMEYLTPLLFPL